MTRFINTEIPDGRARRWTYLILTLLAVLFGLTTLYLIIFPRNQKPPELPPEKSDTAILKNQPEDKLRALTEENSGLKAQLALLEKQLPEGASRPTDEQAQLVKNLTDTIKQNQSVIDALQNELNTLRFPCVPFQEPAEKLFRTTAPVIDGKLDDPVWTRARVYKPFVVVGDYNRAADPPAEAMVAYDSNNIYFAFTCFDDRMSQLVTRHQRRGEEVWRDDSVEVFIDTAGDGKNYYHFMLNAANVQAEGIKREGKDLDYTWSVPWWSATQIGADRWTAEVAIPFRSLGIPPGTSVNGWHINLNRENPKVPELSSWSPIDKWFHEPEHFGTVIEPVPGFYDLKKWR